MTPNPLPQGAPAPQVVLPEALAGSAPPPADAGQGIRLTDLQAAFLRLIKAYGEPASISYTELQSHLDITPHRVRKVTWIIKAKGLLLIDPGHGKTKSIYRVSSTGEQALADFDAKVTATARRLFESEDQLQRKATIDRLHYRQHLAALFREHGDNPPDDPHIRAACARMRATIAQQRRDIGQ